MLVGLGGQMENGSTERERVSYAHWKLVPRTWSAWPWKYFTPRELACKGTGKLKINFKFMDCMDILRSRFGRPISLLSAYRSPYHNARVGGAPLSRHLYADAGDIPIIGMDKFLIERIARETGFTGFGYYRTFLHVDLGRKRTWGGKWNA
jgi:zinc D-Ala-D-Ala carboxypeptidase